MALEEPKQAISSRALAVFLSICCPQRLWAKKPEQDHRFGATHKALPFPGNLPSFLE